MSRRPPGTPADDGGSVVVEFLAVTVLVASALLGLVQLAVWVWARDVASSAAHEGARTAAEVGRHVDDGPARARLVLRDGLGRAADGFDVAGARDGTAVVVRVRGHAPAIVPFLPRFPIAATGRALDEDAVLP